MGEEEGLRGRGGRCGVRGGFIKVGVRGLVSRY